MEYKKDMKILFLTDSITTLGGVQRVTSIIVNELSKSNNITVISRCDCSKRLYYIDPNVEVLSFSNLGINFYFNYYEKALKIINRFTGILDRVGMKSEYYPKRYQKEISEYININKFDVVIGVQGYWAYFLGCIRKRVNCKLVGWQHNSYDAYFNTKNRYYWHQSRISKSLICKLDEYIVLNEYDQELFRKHMNINVAYIYNPKSFDTDSPSDLSHHKFIAAGRFSYAKGYDLIIKAYKKYCSLTENSWPLEIIGAGEEESKYKRIIHDLQLDDNISVLPYTNDIQSSFRMASCLLLSSRWEGMPMIVLEAMEMGVPTISFDIQAIKPLIQDDWNGLVVEKNDLDSYAKAMYIISTNEELRNKYANNSRIKAKEFSIDYISQIWENELKRICKDI